MAAEWGFHKRWTVAGELYGYSTSDFDDSDLLITGGFRFALKENLLLMASIGVPLRRANTDPTRFISYAGIQWLF